MLGSNPYAIGPTKTKHVRVLERRLNHLLGMRAMGWSNDYDRAEIAALRAVIADVRELIAQRQSFG